MQNEKKIHIIDILVLCTWGSVLQLRFYKYYGALLLFILLIKFQVAEIFDTKEMWLKYKGTEHHNICRRDLVEKFKGAEHRNIILNRDALR